MRKNLLFVLILAGAILPACDRSPVPPYLNPDLSPGERAVDLVSRMTLEEKVSQMVYEAPAIERLNIPEYNWWNEALHGVARSGKATVFPQAIGLAAMFDTVSILDVARVISDEARAKYHEFQRKGKRGIYQGLTFWSPNINIFRDPRWGRGMETYGEDPFLTSRMAVAFIKGMQGDDARYLKTVATSKHYVVHSGPEPLRHSFDAVISERDLRDTYLPAFRASVIDADVQSVMCAYNRFMGDPCCGNREILQDILRDEFGFKGYVVSDCWAIRDFYDGHNVAANPEEASAMAVMAGTDLNCGTAFPSLIKAVEKGLISESEIDTAVIRLMKARFQLGMFDPDDKVPYTRIPYENVNSRAYEKQALDAARRSMVLLKNEGDMLPLSKDIGTIAVIGPNADDVEVLLGNYNGTPYDPVTPLRGIREKLGRNTRVLYARGSDHAEGIPYLTTLPSQYLFSDETAGSPGLQAEFFPNRRCEGEPVVSEVHDSVDFNWWDRTPYSSLPDDTFSVRWTGTLVPPVSGRYALGVEAKSFRLFLDDSLLTAYHSVHHAVKHYRFVELEAGKYYPIRLEFNDFHGNAVCRLLWKKPGENLLEEALDVARQADQVILFMGLSPRLEGEEMRVETEGFSGGDRTSLDLPRVQRELIRKIHALGKPTVLVLLNGSPLSVTWEAENLPAILEAWYPGQAAGTAIADILFGDYNPAGRLPVTFYKSVDQLPPFEDYDMKGKTYRYFDKEPLFPFGYGLSYTTFNYTNLRTDTSRINRDGTVTVEVDITNTGTFDGDEVPQLYVRYPDTYRNAPLKDLRGFTRIHLKQGETTTVRFTLGAKELEYYHTDTGEYSVDTGRYEILVGPSSDDAVLLKTKMEVVE